MSPVFLLLFVVGVASARPQEDPGFSRVESRAFNGEFAFRYITGDGTVVEEQGALKRAEDGKSNVLVRKGLYEYKSPEGVPVRVEYTADEKGFVPVSSNIPVAGEPLPVPQPVPLTTP